MPLARPSARVYRTVVDALPMSLRRTVRYRTVHGRLPALRSPRTFTEKVTWRMLRDRRELLAPTCDKLAMKELAVDRAGDRVAVPRTLWSGRDLAELAASDVGGPDDHHWVLKPNHRTGLVTFGSGRPDAAALAETTEGWLDPAEWLDGGEWAYSRARPLLLAEERIGGPDVQLVDHKLYVFDGVVRMVQTDSDRFGAHSCRLYDPDWAYLGGTRDFPVGPPVPRPARLAEMLDAARRIAAGYDFLRVDLYEHDGVVWFGEVTPYPGSGLVALPHATDLLVGSWWTLPH